MFFAAHITVSFEGLGGFGGLSTTRSSVCSTGTFASTTFLALLVRIMEISARFAPSATTSLAPVDAVFLGGVLRLSGNVSKEGLLPSPSLQLEQAVVLGIVVSDARNVRERQLRSITKRKMRYQVSEFWLEKSLEKL